MAFSFSAVFFFLNTQTTWNKKNVKTIMFGIEGSTGCKYGWHLVMVPGSHEYQLEVLFTFVNWQRGADRDHRPDQPGGAPNRSTGLPLLQQEQCFTGLLHPPNTIVISALSETGGMLSTPTGTKAKTDTSFSYIKACFWSVVTCFQIPYGLWTATRPKRMICHALQ